MTMPVRVTELFTEVFNLGALESGFFKKMYGIV
jgi:hypothetical protein